MSKNNRLLSLALAVAALAVAGCAQSQVAQTPPLVAQSRSLAATPTPSMTFHTWTAGKSRGLPSYAGPFDITAGPDGAMWFTDSGMSAIGRITKQGKITEFTAGLLKDAKPYAIVAGAAGNLWFSDICGRIGKITTTGTITEYPIHSSLMGPSGIVADPDGSAWSVAIGPPDALLHIAKSGTIERLRTPSGIDPDGSLGIDGQGNLWMLARQSGAGVMLEHKRSGGFATFATPLQPAETMCCPNLAAQRMTTAANGDVWFSTLYFLSKHATDTQVYGHVSPSGKTTFVRIDSKPVGYPAYISAVTTSGSDLWLAGDDPLQINGALFKIDSQGRQTVYKIPYNAASLTADSAGHLWLTGEGFDLPGQIVEAIPQ